MKIEKVSISENIFLSVFKTDKFKSGVITFTLTLPLDEGYYANNLILAGVLRRGTEKFPKMSDINRRLDELYASCVEIRSTMTRNSLSFIFTAEFLDDKYILNPVDVFGGVLEIISQMILHPNAKNGQFDPEIFAQEVDCVNDALQAEINNTRVYAATRCNELMNRNNKFYPTVDGLLEQIKSITPKSLYEYYKYMIKNTSLEVFYVGSENISCVAEKIKKYFSNFDFCSKVMKLSNEKILLPDIFIAQTRKMSVSQGKLAMGFDTGIDIFNSDYYATLVFNEIFGGSSSSKLFLNVREKMNICYYCSSSYSIYSGKMLVSSGIDIPNKELAKNAILDQLNDIKAGKISDFEFYSAKKSLENCYRQIYDNPLEIQAFYSGRSLFGIKETIDSCREKILAVDVDDVIRVAKKTKYIAEFFVEGDKSKDDQGLNTEDDYE